MTRRFLLLAALVAGCARGQSDYMPEAPIPEAPLSAFAATRMIVLPLQSVRSTDSLGWVASAGGARSVLPVADSTLEAVFRDRGLTPTWALPTELERMARNNPGYVTSPRAIRAGDAIRVMERRRGAEIPEPAGSQLRTLAGFHDARYAMVPVELRFQPTADGRAQPVLLVAVLDVRSSRLVWMSEIGSGDATAYSPQLLHDLATHFADLIVAR
ncbi:MAG TPA: hypothetical protein VF178_11685 [Gemmatimonadaceae bacterium]